MNPKQRSHYQRFSILFLIRIANFHAAVSGKIFQNVSVAQYSKQNSQFHPQCRRDSFTSNLRSLLPLKGRKPAWNRTLAMQLRTSSIYQNGFVSGGSICCNGLLQTLISQIFMQCDRSVLAICLVFGLGFGVITV